MYSTRKLQKQYPGISYMAAISLGKIFTMIDYIERLSVKNMNLNGKLIDQINEKINEFKKMPNEYSTVDMQNLYDFIKARVDNFVHEKKNLLYGGGKAPKAQVLKLIKYIRKYKKLKHDLSFEEGKEIYILLIHHHNDWTRDGKKITEKMENSVIDDYIDDLMRDYWKDKKNEGKEFNFIKNPSKLSQVEQGKYHTEIIANGGLEFDANLTPKKIKSVVNYAKKIKENPFTSKSSEKKYRQADDKSEAIYFLNKKLHKAINEKDNAEIKRLMRLIEVQYEK